MLKLRESNLKVLQKVLRESQEQKAFRESFKRTAKFDFADEAVLKEGGAFPVTTPGFSWKKVAAKLQAELREADAASAYTQFLRAGVQTITNNMYEQTQTTFEDWVTVVQSNKDTELYAPLHGVSFPRQVGPGVPYPELQSAALDIKLQNRKFGSIYSIQKELLDDDQTGQFQRQAGLMGEYMKLLTEVLCYAKLASVANMQYLDYQIPTSETKPTEESVYPWSTGLVGGGASRPASYGAFNQQNLQSGIQSLMVQKNKLGIMMNVTPNRIIVSPKYVFDASVLLNSAYYPSGAAAAGSTGGAFAINPIKGIADLTIARYLFNQSGAITGQSAAWYVVDDSKPWFVLQVRESATVVQENPNSGNSFEFDEHRFKVSGRMNADFIDPRFAWQGSDGSA